MKKQVIMILSLLLAICMLGCTATANPVEAPAADDSEHTIEERFDMASAYIESLIDASKAEVQTDTEDPEYPQRHWFFSGAADGATIPEALTVDGKSFTIGQVTVKELKELGLNIESGSDVIEPSYALMINISDGLKSLTITTAGNDTDQDIPLDDAVIVGFQGGFNEYTIPFDYAGITEASTLKDVLSLFASEDWEGIMGLTASEYDTEITVQMYSTVQSGETETLKSLDITLSYSASSNTATVTNVVLNIDIHPIPEE